MAKFEKKEDNSLEVVNSKTARDAILKSGIASKVKSAALIPLSTGEIRPGDVLSFGYKARFSRFFESEVVLVVQTSVGSGVRLSPGTNNMLLTCFRIENTPIALAVLDRLYNNRVKSSVKRTSRMLGWKKKGAFGFVNFRTYILDETHMTNLRKLTLSTPEEEKEE